MPFVQALIFDEFNRLPVRIIGRIMSSIAGDNPGGAQFFITMNPGARGVRSNEELQISAAEKGTNLVFYGMKPPDWTLVYDCMASCNGLFMNDGGLAKILAPFYHRPDDRKKSIPANAPESATVLDHCEPHIPVRHNKGLFSLAQHAKAYLGGDGKNEDADTTAAFALAYGLYGTTTPKPYHALTRAILTGRRDAVESILDWRGPQKQGTTESCPIDLGNDRNQGSWYGISWRSNRPRRWNPKGHPNLEGLIDSCGHDLVRAGDIVLMLRDPRLCDLVPDLLAKCCVTVARHGLAARTISRIEGLDTYSELLPAVLGLSDRRDVQDALLASPTIRSLVKYKWKILRPLWAVELSLFLLLLASYIAWVVCVFDGTPNSVQVTAFTASSLVLVAPFLAVEGVQRRPRARALMGSAFNTKEIVFDACTYALLIGTTIAPLVGRFPSDDEILASINATGHGIHDADDLGSLGIVVAVTVLFLAGRLITYLSAHERFGFIVQMLVKIVDYAAAFLILMFIITGTCKLKTTKA